MKPIIYALVFGIFLGLLTTDANSLWLKIPGYIMTAWMFLAATILATRLNKDGE